MDHRDHFPMDLTARLEEGISLVNKGQADAAKVIFDQVLAGDPLCAKAFCGRGTAFRILGRIEQAIQDYDAALAIEPDYARALFNRGLARFEKGDIDEALAELDKAIELHAEPGFYYHRAQCFCRVKLFHKAVIDLTECIELDPDMQAATYCQRGTVFLELSKHKEASADFEEALRRNPNEPQLYVWLAYSLSRLEQHERAVSVLDRAIEIRGNDPDLRFRRGCALYCADDFESAIQDFDKAIQVNGDVAEMYYWRGCASEQLRDYETAISDFSEAIAKNGSYFEAFTARGDAFLDMDDSQNAIADLSRAIELNPNSARPFVLRGKAWLKEGNDGRAMDDFDCALQLKPKNKKALRARSQLLVEQGDFRRSEDDLDTLEDALTESSKGENMAQRRTRISLLLSEHFDPLPVIDLAITERQFPYRVRADLQRAVDRLFDQSTRIEYFCGVKKEHSYEGVSFSDLLFPASHDPALSVPAAYEEVDIGEREPARCLKNGLWLLVQGELKYAVFLTPTKEHGRSTGMQFQIAVPKGEVGNQIAHGFFKHLEEAVIKSESYRGKILSLEVHDYYSGMSTGIQVHKLRTVEREQVILPAATLELLDRNIIQFARQRERLAKLGLSTKKGLLFYGPPGTGKTHTIHYLAGAMEGHTTLLISAEQVGLLGEYMTLARLLQPSIVVIEDADLIARERTRMESVCEEVLLNKLLNEMDGLRPDTDVFFILTTNRPESLEAALASRPGRIDQAIEFPLPDDEERAKLVRLYSKAMAVPGEVVAATVKRTERVSAAFIKELMRRAAQFQLERDGTGTLAEADIDAALEELLFAGGSLNCSLLGMQRDRNG
jgi:cell division protease FtsH